MARLLFFLVLAALEATSISLPLTALTRVDLAWPLLFLPVLLGWLVDQLTLRAPKRLERPLLLAGALFAVLLPLAVRLGGLPAGLSALLPGGPNFLLAYSVLLATLYLYWRGSRLDTNDSGVVGTLFGRAAAAAVVSLMLGALARTGAPIGSPVVLLHVVAFISLGLLGLALSHAQDVAGGRLTGLSWRWLLTLLAAIGVVVVVATLAIGLLGGGEAIAIAQGLLQLALLPFAIVGALLAWLLVTFLGAPLTALFRLISAQLQGLQAAQNLPQAPAENGPAAGAFEAIERLAVGATGLMALIPIVILLLAIVLLRQRRRVRPGADEERESLALFASLSGDLRDLLGRLRNPFARSLAGLEAALAALQGSDPSTRVRRSYLRLLLLLEARQRSREATQTPAEFAPAAAATTGAPSAIAGLTEAYQHARYNPAGAAPADADAAEQALRSLDTR